MSFAVRILTIDSVDHHPNADRLSLCQVKGYNCISAKLPDGSHRWSAGDRAIYVPEGALLTEQQLKDHGFWGFNEQQGREMGRLSGRDGNRVKPVELRKIMSTGLLWPVPDDLVHLPDNADVASELGIIKHVPEVPEAMLKVAMPLFEAKIGYDIARLRMYPNLLEGREVVASEKLEGECLILTWMGGRTIDGLFADGQIAITTKGLSEKGLVFKDNEDSRKLGPVQAALNAGLLDKLRCLAIAVDPTAQITLFSEAIGPGIKKLHYGCAKPYARAFDLRMNGEFIDEDDKAQAFAALDLERVPVLYRGPYNRDLFEQIREGKTTISNDHIREGIVVTAVGSQDKVTTELGDQMRPILKLHSDTFLRKFDHD